MSFITMLNPTIQYGCHWDSGGRPEVECSGILYLGGLQQVFSWSTWSGLPKKVRTCFCNPRWSTPDSNPKPQNFVIMANHLVNSG